MSTNETDIDMLRCEQNNHYQSVIIAFDVKDVVFVPHIIH